MNLSWEAVRRAKKKTQLIEVLLNATLNFLSNDKATSNFASDTRRYLQSLSSGRPSTGNEPTQALLRSEYVRRERIEGKFRELLAEGAKIIVFHGLPGMGKTWLAQELSMQAHPDHAQAPLIRIVRGQIEITDLQAALVTSAINTRQPIADDPRQYLAMLLCDDHAPLFTILDSVESADELHTLLPASGARHVVLATCRDRGKAPPEYCRFLKVSEMEPKEAVEMVHKRLPALAKADTNQLVSTLNCYPLVIRYACALIDQQHISVAQFCHDLDVNPGIAGRIYADHDATLLAVLQRMVRVIEATDKGSLKLLMVIASCDMRSAMDRNILWRYASACYNQGQPLTPTRFAQAIDLLERFSLIESKIISRYSPSEDITMHQLTKRLLKQEVVGDELGVIAADFAYLSMTYTQQTRMSKELRLLPGDVAVETLMTHLIMVVLCGEVIIHNHPPGAIAKIPPEVRPGLESYLAFWILRANGSLGKAGLNWRLPDGWVEWAKAYMREHGKLAKLLERPATASTVTAHGLRTDRGVANAPRFKLEYCIVYAIIQPLLSSSGITVEVVKISGQRRERQQASQWAPGRFPVRWTVGRQHPVRWPYQQNTDETDHDREDKRAGVRCLLQGGPFDALRIAMGARRRLAPDRGYAPEFIRCESELPGVDIVYKWGSRDSDGVHLYPLVGRQSQKVMARCGIIHDDVIVEFIDGPLHGKHEWVPRPKDGELPVIHYQERFVAYDLAEPGPHGGYIARANYSSAISKRGSSHGQRVISSTRRRGRPRKDASAEDRARGVTNQDLDDLEFGVRCVLHTPWTRVEGPFHGIREIARFTFEVSDTQNFEEDRGYAPQYIGRPYPGGSWTYWYKWTDRVKGVHLYEFVEGHAVGNTARIVLRASTGRSYEAWISWPYGSSHYAQDDLY